MFTAQTQVHSQLASVQLSDSFQYFTGGMPNGFLQVTCDCTIYVKLHISIQAMAAKKVNPLIGLQELSTRNITYSTALGRGAYATVYKAKCDELPCAAKILHTIFHDDPGLKERFYQECEYLKSIKHPNIVQYLGLCQEPAANQPVLLIEVMDQSLTNFLESSTVPLSRGVQFRLCHDIALALACLHSHKITHRDLSSNNVLLIGPGYRAKVSDFGMSKMIDTTKSKHTTPLTMVPGTAVYMSHEAMGEDPIYTEKLDCFSFGVLAIQIMTRLFPNPLPRQKRIESSISPSGTILVPVLETECRKEHIDMIDKTHPLLSIAIECLELKVDERPTASKLCQRIEVLVDADACSGPGSCSSLPSWEEAKHHYEEEILSLRQSLEVSRSQCKGVAMEQCRKCEELTAIKEDLERKLKEAKSSGATMLPVSDDSSLTIKNWRTGSPAPEGVARSSSTVLQNSMICSFKNLIYNYDIQGDRWKALPQFPTPNGFALCVVFHAELGKLYAFTRNVMYIMYDGQWVFQSQVQAFPRAVLPCNKYFLKLHVGSVNLLQHSCMGSKATLRSTLSISPAFDYASAIICNGAVYLIGTCTARNWSQQVFKYQLSGIVPTTPLPKASWFYPSPLYKKDTWQEIACLPVTRSTCASFNDRLLSVGGIGSNQQASGDIFLYDEGQDKWDVIGRIPTPRYNCLAEVVGDKLVVVGGWLNHFSKCDVVEIATLNF